MATKKSGAKKTTSQSTKTARPKKSASTSNAKSNKATEEILIRRAKSTNWLSILESVVIGVLGVFLVVW